MTTLNDIITSINEQIALGERAAADSMRKTRTTDEQEQLTKYVLVRIGVENIAIPIDGLAEIGPLPPVTPLPNLPSWILGIVGLRGEVISVIDPEMFFLPGNHKVATHGQRLAVLHDGAMKIGFCVSRIIGTVSRPDSEHVSCTVSPIAEAAPEVFGDGLSVGGELYLILDPGKLLKMERLLNYDTSSQIS